MLTVGRKASVKRCRAVAQPKGDMASQIEPDDVTDGCVVLRVDRVGIREYDDWADEVGKVGHTGDGRPCRARENPRDRAADAEEAIQHEQRDADRPSQDAKRHVHEILCVVPIAVRCVSV